MGSVIGNCSPRLPAGRHILHQSRKVYHPAARQAAALFLIAPMIAVSMAPPAPPAIACEMMPPMLRLPDCAAAVIAGSNNVTLTGSATSRQCSRTESSAIGARLGKQNEDVE